MKKKILMLLMIGTLSLSMLTGCAGTGKTGSTNTQTNTTEEKKEEAAEPAKTVEKEDFTQKKEDSEKQTADEQKPQIPHGDPVTLDTSVNLTGKHHIEIDIQGMGTIYAELDADSAPITVTNFVKLAQEGFYTGLTFHRIIDGFMMQGGDPMGNGTGGSKVNIKGEFSENGVENNLSHTRGALSMARAQAPDSASSQFFIVQTDSHFLDGKYAVFGYVTDGMKIVDDICKAAEPIDNNGLVEKSLQPVMEEIRIMD